MNVHPSTIDRVYASPNSTDMGNPPDTTCVEYWYFRRYGSESYRVYISEREAKELIRCYDVELIDRRTPA